MSRKAEYIERRKCTVKKTKIIDPDPKVDIADMIPPEMIAEIFRFFLSLIKKGLSILKARDLTVQKFNISPDTVMNVRRNQKIR